LGFGEVVRSIRSCRLHPREKGKWYFTRERGCEAAESTAKDYLLVRWWGTGVVGKKKGAGVELGSVKGCGKSWWVGRLNARHKHSDSTKKRVNIKKGGGGAKPWWSSLTLKASLKERRNDNT